MRAPLLIALVLLGTAPAWAAEEPSGCDKFKWNIDHERAALTAPDRVKLASGGELAALPSTGMTLALRAPAEAKLPTPPERAPKEGTFAGFAGFKSAAEGRHLHRQPVRGRLGRPGAGRACPEAEGLQRRHRLRRHPQDHEIRDRRQPVRAAGQRNQGEFGLDRDPAVRIDKGTLYPDVQPAIVFTAISRSTVSRRDGRNGASACRIPVQPTPDLRARKRAANTHGAPTCIVLPDFSPPSSSCADRPSRPPWRRTRP